jgi:hypothetical protein
MKMKNMLSAWLPAVLCLTAAVAVAAGAGRGVAQGARGMVTLLHAPGTSTLRVPLPEAFTRLQAPRAKGAKTAAVTINFLPAGSPDTQWGDTAIAWPADARAAVNYAASVWEALLNPAVPIVIDAAWVNNLGSGVLGHSGALNNFRDFSGAPVASTWYSVALANTLHGSDLDAAAADVYMGFSSIFSWYTGTDGSTPGSKVDLVSVVLHEICHGLGFAGSMAVAGGSGSWGSGTAYPKIYDRCTENGSGQLLISAFANGSAALASQLTGGTLYFNGALATAANGGAHPKLYAPATWNPGSSYSHLDETFNGTPNALMTYSLPNGESIHSPGPVTMGLLNDIGWPNNSGGTGTFTLATLKAKVYWTQKKVPAGLLPVGVGDLTLIGSTPTMLSDLSALNGVTLSNSLLITSPEPSSCSYGGNLFIKLNGSAKKAVFGTVQKDFKYKWLFTVWLSKGQLWVKAQAKNIPNQSAAFGVTSAGGDWTTKTLQINMDVVGGGLDLHAVGAREIRYKTKDGTTTTIK